MLVFSLFDIRVVPHFFSPFVIGSNQFEIVDLLTFTAVRLQVLARTKIVKIRIDNTFMGYLHWWCRDNIISTLH